MMKRQLTVILGMGGLLLSGCNPSNYMEHTQSQVPEGSKASSHVVQKESFPLGNFFKGNVEEDFEGGLGAFSDNGTKGKKHNVRATIYYIPDEKNFSGSKACTVHGKNGRPIAKVSCSFMRELTLQGSGILADGRTVNIASKGRYFVTPHKYGVGSTPDKPLIPFRSLAVDVNYWRRMGYKISNGDKVYIKSTDGMKIPGTNEVHNGVWEVSDRGGAIKGNRIDMFFGTMHWRKALPYLRDSNNFTDKSLVKEATGIGDKNRSIGLQFIS